MQSQKEKGTSKVFREAGQRALLSCAQSSHPALTDHTLYDVCLLACKHPECNVPVMTLFSI